MPSMERSAHLHWTCACVCQASCDPMNCSPPGFSAHGSLQAGILEWVAMPSSRGSSQPRDQTCVSYVSCSGVKLRSGAGQGGGWRAERSPQAPSCGSPRAGLLSSGCGEGLPSDTCCGAFLLAGDFIAREVSRAQY